MLWSAGPSYDLLYLLLIFLSQVIIILGTVHPDHFNVIQILVTEIPITNIIIWDVILLTFLPCDLRYEG